MLVLYSDYQVFEETRRQRIIDCGADMRLLLIPAHNNLDCIAMFRAAISLRRVVGIADENVLTHLECTPVEGLDGDIWTVNHAQEIGPKLVCFTAGATGQSKGILRTYDSWIRSFEMHHGALGYSQDASVLIIGSLAHSMHLYGAMESLYRNVVPEILDGFSPRRVVSTCRDLDIRIFYATPTHLSLISDYAESCNVTPLVSVTHIMTGGAKLDETRLKKLGEIFPNARIVEFFGTAETSYITLKSPDAPTGSVGKACPGVSIRILDNDGLPVSHGTEGTLWVKSDMLFERYLFGDDINTKWEDGYVTVGDQGYVDVDGNFFFSVRKGLMVTIAGENVFIDTIESVLRAWIADRECAIVPISDELRGNRLVAVTQDGVNPEIIEETLTALRQRFGSLKSPKTIIQLKDWPCLPSGKLDRQALKRQVAERL